MVLDRTHTSGMTKVSCHLKGGFIVNAHAEACPCAQECLHHIDAICRSCVRQGSGATSHTQIDRSPKLQKHLYVLEWVGVEYGAHEGSEALSGLPVH